MVPQMTHFLSSVIISFLYGVACTGLGLMVLKWVVRYSDFDGESSTGTGLATSFFLGQGCLVALWTFLSLCGWFSPIVIAIVLLLSCTGLFAGREDIRKIFKDCTRLFKRATDVALFWKIILILTSLVVLEQAASCFLPVIGDAAAFYMVLPKIMAASHRLMPLPGYRAFSAIGFFGEFHFAALMSLASPDAAKFFVFWTAIATTAFIVFMGKSIGLGWCGQIVSVIILFTSTAFTLIIGDGKVDLFGASLGVAAYYWALQTGGKGGSKTLFLAGLFTGLAVMAKLTYLPVLLPGILLIVGWRSIVGLSDGSVMRSVLKTIARPLCLLLFWVLVGLTPMIVKNTLLFNAPFAPFFGMEGWIFSLSSNWFSPEVTRRIVLTYPFALTFGFYPWQYGNISPIALAFCPLILRIPRPPSMITSRHIQVTLAALAGLAIWVFLRPSVLAPRYYLAPLLVLSLPVAQAVELLMKPRVRFLRFRAILVASLILVLVISTGQFGALHQFAARYFLGKVSECGYVSQQCQAARVINSEAHPGDRVFSLNYYTYYLRPDILQNMGTVDDFKEGLQLSSKTWEKLYFLGYRYIFIEGSAFAAWDRMLSDLSLRPSSLSIETIFQEGTYRVYRISSKSPTPITPRPGLRR